MAEVRVVAKGDVDALIGSGKEGVRVEPHADFYGIYDGDQLVSVCSLEIRGRLAVLSTDYTVPSHRGRGYHKELLAHRLTVAKGLGAETAQATCLSASVANYLKAGFVVVQQFKHGWRMRRTLVREEQQCV